MKKHLFIITIQLLLSLCVAVSATTRTIDDIPNVHLSDSLRHVSDPDNILSHDTRTRIDAIVEDLWEKTSSEMSVVVVDSAATDDPDAFATELFTRWGIGKHDNDNGILIFVAAGQGKIVIRTGYGLEGIVPDIVAGRIIRNIAIPKFKQGDMDGGLYDTVTSLHGIITDPDVRAEVMSDYANNQNIMADIDTGDILSWWIGLGAVSTVVMAIFHIATIYRTRRRDPYEQYHALHELLKPEAIASAIGLGIPLIMLLITYLTMRRVRTRPRICGNCGHTMHRLDEVSDNAYLTPAQDVEERINSVDYDVWLCDNCGETDILPFVNKSSAYQECRKCHARAAALRSDRIIVQPTTSHEGRGVKTYVCSNCHDSFDVLYTIPRLETPPIVILPPGGGGSSGGFSGGSFGGGATGGGGASGSW